MKAKKTKTSLLFMLSAIIIGYSQISINSSGKDLTGNGFISYSLGQLVTTTNSSDLGSSLHGVQIALEHFTLGEKEEIRISSKAIVYPNPVGSHATLSITTVATNMSYRLFTSQGILLLRSKITEKSTIIPMDNLSRGIYFLQVVDNNNLIKTFKIIKN